MNEICMMDLPPGGCLHDTPEMSPCFGHYVCPCEACTLSLEAAIWGGKMPDLKVCIKFGGPRQVISAETYIGVMRTVGSKGLLALSVNDPADEYIREVFIIQEGSASCQCHTRNECKRKELERELRRLKKVY